MNEHIYRLAILFTLAAPVSAQSATPAAAIARMPVKEITVFKDGHSFVLHRGKMATDERGNVVLDHLPTPVMGTFWPFSADAKRPLQSVTAGRRRVRVERTALGLHELLRANVGAEVSVTLTTGEKFAAGILGFLVRSAEEIERSAPPGADRPLSKTGDVILLKTSEGTRVHALSSIRDVVFRGAMEPKLAHEEFRELLTLRLDWGAKKPQPEADVGMAYLQKGIRWIPSYRVTIDGNGKAKLELKATLINEMVDLDNVTANLVIGVPSFAFADSIDPIAVQKAVAQLSQHFQSGSQNHFMSNAIMTQSARMGEYRAPGGTTPAAGSGDAPFERNEDLFVYTLPGITLRKGERMVVPVATFELPYEDVFKLDVPMLPPAEIRRQLNSQQQQELARLFHRPKVKHAIRLRNSGAMPLTTAPALISGPDGLIGQGMMTYTSAGSVVDLELTAAIDIAVVKKEHETGRTQNAIVWHNNHYSRTALAGELCLVNHKKRAVALEVTRYVLGKGTSVDSDGSAEQVNLLENDEAGVLGSSGVRAYWYYGSYWWNQVNPVTRLHWKLSLEPGKEVKLGYAWEYYWR